MIRLSILTLGALALFGCSDPAPTAQVPDAPQGAALSPNTNAVELVSDRAVPLAGVLSPSDLAVEPASGDLFVLDGGTKTLQRFSATGDPVVTIGREGQGPGEFESPKSIALRDDDVLVGDANHRFSFFSQDGTFKSSFVSPEAIHVNSRVAFLSDSTVLVGGEIPQPDRSASQMLHVHKVDGTPVKSFFPLSRSAAATDAFLISGASFTMGSDGHIYALQPTEYSVAVFDASGREVDRLAAQPDYFDRLTQPEPFDGGMEELTAWTNHFDKPLRIHALDNGLLAVAVKLNDPEGPAYSVDLIDPAAKAIVGQHQTDEKLMATLGNELYFVSPPTPEGDTELRVYRVDSEAVTVAMR